MALSKLNLGAWRPIGDAKGGGSTVINGFSTAELGSVVKNLAPRWFLMRDVHARVGTILLQPRWAMSLLRGPMTRNEIKQALDMRRLMFPSKSRIPQPKPAIAEGTITSTNG
jgi:hypothetical protein